MPSLAELRDIVTAINEARAMVRACDELIPSFRAWARDQPTYVANRTYSVVNKSADSFVSLGDAFAAGAILPLPTAQQQPVMINPTDAVSNAMLRHRPDLNRGGEGL